MTHHPTTNKQTLRQSFRRSFQSRLSKLQLSKLQLSLLVTLYLYLLNFISNLSLSDSLSSFWLALLMFVISLIISLLPKVIFKLFLASQIFMASLAVFVKFSYKVTLTTDIMLSGLMNESDLTLEMLSWRLILWLMVTAIVPIIILLLTKITAVGYFHHLFRAVLSGGLTLAVIIAYFFIAGYQFRAEGNIRDPRFVTDLANFSPLDAQYNLNRARRAYKKLKQHQSQISLLSQTYDYQANMDDLLIVLVIGETTRGDHFALNGYNKNTTPNLAKVPNLYSFVNAQSCDTLTVNSIYCMTSMLTKNDKQRLPNQSSVGEVLKSQGYHTQIYSLQTMSEFYKYLHYDKLISKYAVLHEQNKGSKDVALLPYAKSAIENYTGGKQLLVLHTLGSHQTYSDRLSTEHQVFTPFCTNPDVSQCTTESLNNAFDNTIIAVDDFLSQVITLLQNKKAILIYASDHGESLGEQGHYFHGEPVSSAPKEQFQIPFIVWFSDKYLADDIGQNNAKNLQTHWQANHNDSYQVSHDNLFHSLLGCAGIESSAGIDANLNLCSSTILSHGDSD